MKHDEHPIQVSIADFLRVALPETAIFFAVPNGAELKAKTFDKGGGQKGRVSFAAIRLQREGLTKGVADIIVIDDDLTGGSLVIGLEVKSATGRQSDDQKKWAQKAQKAGVRYHVVRSIEDAARALASEGVRLRAIPSTMPGRLYQAV